MNDEVLSQTFEFRVLKIAVKRSFEVSSDRLYIRPGERSVNFRDQTGEPVRKIFG